MYGGLTGTVAQPCVRTLHLHKLIKHEHYSEYLAIIHYSIANNAYIHCFIANYTRYSSLFVGNGRAMLIIQG